MAKPKSNGYGEGTFVESRIFLSPAFLSLGQPGTAPSVSNCSAQILLLFLGKRQYGSRKDRKGQKVWERMDGNRFTMTYKELEARGITQQRATRAFDELLAKGFISIVDPGGAYEKHKAVFALENDYRSWRPGDPPVKTRKKDVHRGYQGKGLGAVGKKKLNTARVNVGHPHTRQRGTPNAKTHTLAWETMTEEESAENLN